MAIKVLHLFSSAPLCLGGDVVSSTLSVERRDEPKDSKKKVTFDLSFNEFHANKVICREECSTLSYNESDYRHFKHKIASTAKAVQRESDSYYSYERVLEHTYELCCTPFASEDDDEYCQNNMPITKEDLYHLNRWAALAPGRVGIQKWAVPTIGKKESIRRVDVVGIVLSLQEDDAHVNFLLMNKQEILRKRCERISRPSRLFAAVMARARATALLEETSKEEFFS